MYESHFRRLEELIREKAREQMGAIDDLNTGLTALEAEVAAVVTTVNDLLTEVQNLGSSSPAIEAAVARVQAATSTLSTLAADDPGPNAGGSSSSSSSSTPAAPAGAGDTSSAPADHSAQPGGSTATS